MCLCNLKVLTKLTSTSRAFISGRHVFSYLGLYHIDSLHLLHDWPFLCTHSHSCGSDSWLINQSRLRRIVAGIDKHKLLVARHCRVGRLHFSILSITVLFSLFVCERVRPKLLRLVFWSGTSSTAADFWLVTHQPQTIAFESSVSRLNSKSLLLRIVELDVVEGWSFARVVDELYFVVDLEVHHDAFRLLLVMILLTDLGTSK